ncbi:hypothetical protein MMC30_003080 [Trapelia coarctata]|nr:hypothetical protein [Trapelia coarctata]
MDLQKGTDSNVLVDSSPIKGCDTFRATSGIHDFDDIVIDPNDPGEIRAANIRRVNGLLRRLRNFETWMDRKMKFEAMGVERIPEDKRKPPQILNMMFFWFSMLLNPTFIPIGALGPIFGLSVHTSVILTVFATLIGTASPAFTATLSPFTGLRMIAVSRYSFGIWGAKLCGFLNIIVNIGFAVISSMFPAGVSVVLGIVLIVAAAFVVSFFGYAIIHHYDRYAWIFAFILLCVLWGQSAVYFSPAPGLSLDSGVDYSGACLTGFAVIFGLCCSWCPISGDYYVHYPADISKWLVFSLTYTGITVWTVFVAILGNYVGGIITSNADLASVYEEGGIGAIILACMRPDDWAKFACVFLFLSPSRPLLQLWGKHFITIPRFLWCLILSLIALALGLGGRNVLEPILTNLLALLGYWTLSFGAVLFMEHFLFRKRLGGYDLSAWQDRWRMPWGVAGTGALLVGIGVSFAGMNLTWASDFSGGEG